MNAYLGDPRVLFAAERTLLAWQRSAIALMGFGFVVERFGLFLQSVMHESTGGSEYSARRRSAPAPLVSVSPAIQINLASSFSGPGFGEAKEKSRINTSSPASQI